MDGEENGHASDKAQPLKGNASDTDRSRAEAPRQPVVLNPITVAEQSVLGGLLLDNRAIERVNGLAVEHFQSSQHRLIYSAICDQIEDGAHGAADVVTVYERLKRNGTADDSVIAYLNKLAANTPSAANVGGYAKIVEDAGRRRLLAKKLAEAKQALDKGDEAAALAILDAAKQAAPKPIPAIAATPYIWRAPSSIPPRDWLFRQHYIRKFLVVTAGPAGGAKSSITLVDLVSMAIGRDLLTAKPLPNGSLRVWLYNTEDPREEIERRLAGVCLYYNVTAADFGNRLFIDTARERKLVIAASVNGQAVSVPRVIDELVDEIKARQIDVFAADPLIHTHAVPENDNTGMGEVMSAWREVAERGDCCVELTHHIRKNGGQDTAIDDMRGGSSILGTVRSARLTTTMSREDAKQFGIAEDQRRFYVWVNPTGKPSLVPPVARRDWYFMESVDLGNATATHPSDRVGVATRWSPPGAFDDITLDDARRVWMAIYTADAVTEARANSQSDAWVGKLVAKVLDLDLDEAGTKEKVNRMVKEWERSGAIKRSRVHDARNGREVPVFVLGSAEKVWDDDADSDPI